MRGGFVLIGAFVVATAVSGIGHSISYGTLVQGSTHLSTVVIGALIGSLFGVVPGVFLIVRARQLASRVFPQQPAESHHDLNTLLCGLSALLGMFLLVASIGDLIAGITVATSMAALSNDYAVGPGREAVSALIRLGAGAFLFFKAEMIGGILSEGP